MAGKGVKDNSPERNDRKKSKASPGLANTDLDLARDEDVEFEDENDPEAREIHTAEEHHDVDDEVRMRAKRVIRSRRHSLGYEGASFDEENDSRLIHN